MIEITKEEMIVLLEDNIYWVHKDVSDPHHDIRDYEYLNDTDYEQIASNILEDLEVLFSKKRSIKIEKIKKNINS